LTAGLLAHWRLDEASGTTVSDSSGHGYHASFKPGPVWTSGKIGGGLKFDGMMGEAVYLNTRVAFIPANSRISISVWVKHDSFAEKIQRYVSLGYYVPGQPEGQPAVIRYDNGQLSSYMVGNSQVAIRVPAGLTVGTWHHIAFTWDGSIQRLYRDGVEVGSKAGGNLIAATATVLGSPEGIQGTLDDVRIYNRTLSAGEIASLYAP
jgi:hypothetical protein